MNYKLSLALAGVLLLTACGTALTAPQNAANAMAETACLLFDDSATTKEEMASKTTEIMTKYGYGDASEIDTYLTTIQGTEELNTVTTTLRDALTANCGTTLDAKGVTADDLSKAMVSQ